MSHPFPSHFVPSLLLPPCQLEEAQRPARRAWDMAQPGGLCLLALLVLGFGVGGSPACYDPRGLPRRCMPVFENAAFGRAAWATNTCGSPPEDYCQQMGARHASQLCQRCDAADPRLHHNASLLTDFHSQEESTWWQSQSMAFGIQHPNSVNITLRLGRRGKRSLGTGGAEPPGAGRWWWEVVVLQQPGAGLGWEVGCSTPPLFGVRVPLCKDRVFLWSGTQAGPPALTTHLGAFCALGKRWGCRARSPSSQHIAGGAPYILGRSQPCKHHAAPAGFPS